MVVLFSKIFQRSIMNESWSSEDREIEDSEDDYRRRPPMTSSTRHILSGINARMYTSRHSSEGGFSEEENTSERSHVEPEMLSSLSAENLQVLHSMYFIRNMI